MSSKRLGRYIDVSNPCDKLPAEFFLKLATNACTKLGVCVCVWCVKNVYFLIDC